MFPIVLLTLVVCNNQVVYGEIKIGEIKGLKHDVGGTVYYVDDRTLKIKGFTYDGLGPDAFFLVGTEGSPSDCIPDGCPTATILPYPFNGTFYDYDDPTIPILKGYIGDKELTLKIPTSLKITDIKWFSVWCREYTVDFGHFFFDLKNVDTDVTSETEPDTMPEPTSEVTEFSQATEKEPEAEPVKGEIKVGEIIRGVKDVGGTVYYVEDHKLKIKGFTYDGKGTGAFFLAGTDGKPSDCTKTVCRGASILPYPFNGIFYDYDDPTIPIIKDAFTGDKDITLETPTSLKTTDIKWFSVWSRESAVDFGHSYFDLTNVPKDVTPEIIRSEKVSEPATEVAESSQGTEKETETEPAKETNPGPETPDEITESSPGTSKDPTTQQENGSASFKTFSLLLNMLMIICGLMFLPSS